MISIWGLKGLLNKGYSIDYLTKHLNKNVLKKELGIFQYYF